MVTQIQTCTLAELERRLNGIGDILRRSSDEIYKDFSSRREFNSTGFQSLNTFHLQGYIEEIIKMGISLDTHSLDMGCGNGGFALMAAAAGYPSFAIDASPYLIGRARENLRSAIEEDLIDPLTVCKFAVGNMYPQEYVSAYEECALGLGKRYRATTPIGIKGQPYEELGVKISDFGIIYSFPWSEHMKFLTDFLAREARENAIFVLPHWPAATNFIYKNRPSVELKRVSDEGIWKKVVSRK